YYFFGVGGMRRSGDALEQRLGCQQSHLAQRLPYSGQRRVLKSCTLNVVEAHDRNVFRNAPPRFAQRANRADRRNVIKCKKGGEWFFCREEFLSDLITEVRRR